MKSDLLDETKWELFQAIYVSVLLYGTTNSNEMLGEKFRWKLRKDTLCCLEQIWEAVHNQTAAAQPLTSHLTNQVRQATYASEVRTIYHK